MQIGSTELLIILVIIIVAYAFYKGRQASPARSTAKRTNQQAENGQAGGEDTRSDDPGKRAADAKDPYVVLNVPRTATQDEITAAYKKLAQMYHPDKVAGLAPEYYAIAEQKMREINAAYAQIGNRSGNGR